MRVHSSNTQRSIADGVVPQWFYYALYLGTYGSCSLVLLTGADALDLVVCAASYTVRSFGLSIGYHRYFAHRSFTTGRAFQFILALIGTLSAQQGVSWWAHMHRQHHRTSDTPLDPHSPRYKGFIYSYFFWSLDRRYNGLHLDGVPDIARFPELVWLSKWHFVPLVLFALAILYAFGWSGLVWGFIVSTVLLWQPTFAIVAISHGPFGYRRYVTPDDTNNNWLISLVSFGEGWHNNHHHVPYSARQGFGRYEFDVSWWIIRGLQRIGIVWDVKLPPTSVIAGSTRSVHEVAIEEWLLVTRAAITEHITREAARWAGVNSGGFSDEPRRVIETRFDEFRKAVQDLLIRGPHNLPAQLARFKRSVAQDMTAANASLGEDGVRAVVDQMNSTLAGRLEVCPLRHLFERR